jgi:glucose-6-phosphate dehydrogenase assembly protein OpcA
MSTSIIYPAQPEQILKSLGKLWTSLGQEEKEHGKPTVLRACAMTLIVATGESDGGFSASQTISELMHEHPSRGIVLAVSDRAEKDLEARVLAQCWKPFGKAQQICCEQIEITARPQSWPNVGPTLIGLLVADLPVVFWCRYSGALGPAATAHQKAGIEAVMSLATKTIIDTKDQDVESCFARMREWRARGRHIADLEWTRLTAWREPIAQLFDSVREVPFSHFDRVEVSYANDSPPASALYLASWLAHPFHAKISLTKTSGCGPGVQKVTLHSPEETIEFERNGRECMTLRSTRTRQRDYSYSDPSLYTLMNEELAVIGPDPAFDDAFDRTQEILRYGL